MKLIREAVSLTAKFDYVLMHEDMVAIVEVKAAGQNYYTVWWVAGLTPQKRLAVAFQAQFALDITDPKNADRHIEEAAKPVFSLARESLVGGGVRPIPLMDGKELPKALASTFLYAFESQGLFKPEVMELNLSTGLQYEFCQLLKVSKPVEFLAEYLKVPVTTVRQRITWARNKGVLPKLRGGQGGHRA